ncbi:Iron-sulfur assembly protein 1 [Paecilomyces lecythidis]|uniref:Iron-sulfur assembly protein 1 n=1 Tax=Paecilomyces lecythidis TaxID=3004212 RepID=A0ABR3WMW2_9EURO
MSLCRVGHPTVTSSQALFRFITKPSNTGCAHSLRSFSSYQNVHRTSSRRDMQTATAYRPHTLDNFPPPRNTGSADTSISADLPSTRETNNYPAGQKSSVSMRESEAQKPKPTTSSAAAPSTSQTTKPRRSRLRPRKAAMKLTPTAIYQLKQLLDQPEPKLIRVGVKNRGCSGLAYHLEFVEKPGPFDEVVEQDGVKVLIDSKALFSIIGSEMDWQEDKLSRRFVFRNPNIKEQCGCGESFMV